MEAAPEAKKRCVLMSGGGISAQQQKGTELPSEERRRIVELIGREVIPSVGCTEPICVALCVARATEALHQTDGGCSGPSSPTPPSHVTVRLSANILKNAMGVGIPGTGMIGLPIAIALGALIGKSSDRLELLKSVTPEDVERGRRFIDEKRVTVGLKEDMEDATEKLYVEAEVTSGEGTPPRSTAVAVIAGGHTTFRYVAVDGKVLLDARKANKGSADNAGGEADQVELSMRKVWDFATASPVDELRFILEAKRLNKAAAERSLEGNFGHSVGKTLRCQNKLRLMGDSVFTRILCQTSAACDARMAGALIPVMSNSGSGNQGIAATLPVAVYAEEMNATEEQTIRALALSHLTVIYIKQSLGRLSALCGCVAAATGSSCGVAYLMGGGLPEVSASVKNMIANLTGMICDGAKPSCAMKLVSGVSTAVLSALMAMEHKCVTAVEGIIEDDVDRCIRNLTRIGRDGMGETDKLVLDIMTNKCCC